MKTRNKTTKFPVVRIPAMFVYPIIPTERVPLDFFLHNRFFLTLKGAHKEDYAEG